VDKQSDIELTNLLLSKAAEAKRDVRFPGTHFVGMLNADGGYKTVQTLLRKKDPSPGFVDLWELGRVDLTVEAIIVQSKWRHYFDKALIDIAEKRLKDIGYAFTPFPAEEISGSDEPAPNVKSTVTDPSTERAPRRFWWVNQNQTYKAEVPGGFLWSPKTRTDGVRNQFYENMREVVAGDIVFSFCDGLIKAIGIAKGPAQSAPKPDFGSAGASWSNEGWLVPVDFTELKHLLRPKDHIAQLKDHLPEKYSPLTDVGNGLQSVYLAAVPPGMAAVLAELIGAEYLAVLKSATKVEEDLDDVEDRAEEAIRGRTDLKATTKEQLVKARRGQGIFKANVRLNEKACRVTGVAEISHLRASHIKPWSVSDDQEKLDGCNGLLLAPHVDHLFDRGFISFTPQGDLLVSAKLPATVLNSWGIALKHNVGLFNGEQARYLEYHRQNIFKG
jgi:hypothetical protein